jgi:hypothetical protein
MLGKDFVGVFQMVGLGVPIRNAYIHNGVRAVRIKSMEEKISTLIITVASRIWVGDSLNRWLDRQGHDLIWSGAFEDQRFSSHGRWGHGVGGY